VFLETGMKCAYYTGQEKPIKGSRPSVSNGRLA
jgi:hypothetical protein